MSDSDGVVENAHKSAQQGGKQVGFAPSPWPLPSPRSRRSRKRRLLKKKETSKSRRTDYCCRPPPRDSDSRKETQMVITSFFFFFWLEATGGTNAPNPPTPPRPSHHQPKTSLHFTPSLSLPFASRQQPSPILSPQPPYPFHIRQPPIHGVAKLQNPDISNRGVYAIRKMGTCAWGLECVWGGVVVLLLWWRNSGWMVWG